jgi:hypothetical protein
LPNSRDGCWASYPIRREIHAGLEGFHRRFCYQTEISVELSVVKAQLLKLLLKFGYVRTSRVERKYAIPKYAFANIRVAGRLIGLLYGS